MAIGSGKETYAPLLETGKIRLIGFEPDAVECAKLNETSDNNRQYYPHFVGDGGPATYYETNLTMTGSLFEPCVDGSLLARIILTLMQSWLVLPCVRPVCAALLLVRWP